MKKAGKVAIAISIIIVILGACVLADYLINGSIKDRLNGLLKGSDQQEVVDEIKKVTDEITSQKSEENKQDYEDYENNKLKSEDVVIPEDAPEEEKQELQQKILYLKVLENIERIYSNNHTPINSINSADKKSSIIGIKDFVYKRVDQESFKYLCVADTMNYANGKYFKSTSILTFNTKAKYKNIEEINEYLNDVNSAQESHVFYDSENCMTMGTKIFSDIMEVDLSDEGDWTDRYDIIACGEDRTEDNYYMNYLIKYSTDNGSVYQIWKVLLTWKAKGKTEKEFKNFVMNNKIDDYRYNLTEQWFCSEINWKETLQEFLDSGVA